MSKSELQSLLTKLAAMRQRAESLRASVANYQAAMFATPEGLRYQAAKMDSAQAADNMTALENRVREMTTELYNANPEGGKKPAPGVGIRVSRVPAYDPARARQYCLDKLPGFMILDTKKFDKIALDLGLDFVTAEETITATIASDLSEYLPAEPSSIAQPEPTGAAAEDDAA